MTTENTSPQGTAAPAAASPVAPAVAPAQGAAPQAPAAPPKPAIDTKAIVENRKLKMKLEQLRKAGEATAPQLALLKKLQDPKTKYEAASELGLKYEEWTQRQLESLRDKKEDEGSQLPPEAQERLDRLEAAEKAREEAAKNESAQAERKQAVEAATAFVTQNAEKLPLSAALGLGEAMLLAYHADAKKNGARDELEFAEEFEGNLEKQIEQNLSALAGTSKGKALMARLLGAQAAPPTANPKQADPTAATRTARTLTNGHSSETPPATDPRTLPGDALQKKASRHFA